MSIFYDKPDYYEYRILKFASGKNIFEEEDLLSNFEDIFPNLVRPAAPEAKRFLVQSCIRTLSYKRLIRKIRKRNEKYNLTRDGRNYLKRNSGDNYSTKHSKA